MDGSKPVNAIQEAPGNQIPPRITVYKDRNFKGDQSDETGGYDFLGDDWSDDISSFKIHAGEFEFYPARDYGPEDWGPVRLGVGDYPWVVDAGIKNDSISSWKAFYGVGVPAPIVRQPSAPTGEEAYNYAGIDHRDDPSCGRGNYSSWLYNKHPSRKIKVTYYDSASPQNLKVADMDPNKEYPAGRCQMLNVRSTEFIN
ncbi:beta/gamma crystallin-related protein [Fibrella forsythiae]|uniref:Beta/gamma crystallin 'Greek key' domain-containing protein n=1 Tax=Fibrella forsythiae TaxID=2817061 RepID=A0ABS3JBY0_9BACT|nr:beta/gamma crystallin-related protein [Fibrella forsythiae]MBO0947509.1 hypothetical protein [Fibrella forsythiae]